MNEVSNLYSQALYSLALENEKVDLWQQQLKQISAVVNENPGFYKIMAYHNINKQEKKDLLQQIFKDSEAMLVNFLDILIDNNRFNCLADISMDFNQLCNQGKGISQGVVYSPYPLTATEISELEKAVGNKHRVKVELTLKIDSSLIQGVKIIVDGKIIDGSLKNKMASLKADLLRESR